MIAVFYSIDEQVSSALSALKSARQDRQKELFKLREVVYAGITVSRVTILPSGFG